MVWCRALDGQQYAGDQDSDKDRTATDEVGLHRPK